MIRTSPPENNLQYWQKVNGFVNTELTVKDVCANCNNGPLSALDAYVNQLYDIYFDKFVREGESINFQYDFEQLARWLLKTIYNSARAHKSDPGILCNSVKYMLSGEQRPAGLTVFLQLITPHKINPNDAHILPESIQAEGEIVPYMVRIAEAWNPQLIRYSGSIGLYRLVALNSYYFHVLIPLQSQFSRPVWRSLSEDIRQRVIPGGCRLSSGRAKIDVPASECDFLDVFGPSIEANFDTYKKFFESHTKTI